MIYFTEVSFCCNINCKYIEAVSSYWQKFKNFIMLEIRHLRSQPFTNNCLLFLCYCGKCQEIKDASVYFDIMVEKIGSRWKK
jgi:hypothetical protein